MKTIFSIFALSLFSHSAYAITCKTMIRKEAIEFHANGTGYSVSQIWTSSIDLGPFTEMPGNYNTATADVTVVVNTSIGSKSSFYKVEVMGGVGRCRVIKIEGVGAQG